VSSDVGTMKREDSFSWRVKSWRNLKTTSETLEEVAKRKKKKKKKKEKYI